MQDHLLSNALGIISSWGSVRRRKRESQIERNSVARPLVLIEIAIFFSSIRFLMESEEIKGCGDELRMSLLSFRVHDGIYSFVQLIFTYLSLF